MKPKANTTKRHIFHVPLDRRRFFKSMALASAGFTLSSYLAEALTTSPIVTQGPYYPLANNIPLDEMNSPLGKLQGKALYWAKKSHELDLDEGDAADEDTLNRILWHATRGYDTPYPETFAGANKE